MSYSTDNRDCGLIFCFHIRTYTDSKVSNYASQTSHDVHKLCYNSSYSTEYKWRARRRSAPECQLCLYHEPYQHAFKLSFPRSPDLYILPKNALRTLARHENDSLRANQRDSKPGSLHLIDLAKTPHAYSLRLPRREPVRTEYPSTTA
jgi:hypothetical protein